MIPDEHNSEDGPSTSLSAKQIAAGLGSAGTILGFILIAAFWGHTHFVKTYVIGPSGLFAGTWLILFICGLSYLAAGESTNSDT